MRRSAWKIFWCVGVSCIFAISNSSPQRVDAATLQGRYTSIHITPRHDLTVADDKTVFAFQYQPETTYDVAVDLQNMTSQTHKLAAQFWMQQWGAMVLISTKQRRQRLASASLVTKRNNVWS